MFPTIKAVAAALASIKVDLGSLTVDGDDDDGLDVRLQVLPGGGWDVLWRDAQYDTDHRGWWATGYIDRRTNVRELARELIEGARDDQAMAG